MSYFTLYFYCQINLLSFFSDRVFFLVFTKQKKKQTDQNILFTIKHTKKDKKERKLVKNMREILCDVYVLVNKSNDTRQSFFHMY